MFAGWLFWLGRARARAARHDVREGELLLELLGKSQRGRMREALAEPQRHLSDGLVRHQVPQPGATQQRRDLDRGDAPERCVLRQVDQGECDRPLVLRAAQATRLGSD